MNSAQAAFLHFVRPRSWNELISGSFFRLRMATLLNPDLILKWTQLRQLFYTLYSHDLEMNSAQAAFLDFVRPRCWTLAWWNELSSGSLFRLRTANVVADFPDLEMNSAQAASLDFKQPFFFWRPESPQRWLYFSEVSGSTWNYSTKRPALVDFLLSRFLWSSPFFPLLLNNEVSHYFLFLIYEYEGLMNLRKKQNDDSREGRLLSFAQSQTLELRKNGNLELLGHKRCSFLGIFFIIFFCNKT